MKSLKKCTYGLTISLVVGGMVLIPITGAFADTTTDTSIVASTTTDQPSSTSDQPVATPSEAPVDTTTSPSADTPPVPAAAPVVQNLFVPAPQVVPDTTKPVATLDAAPSILNSTRTSFTIEGSDDVGLAKIVGNIYKNGSLFKGTQSTVSGLTGTHVVDLSGLAEGVYTLKYNALDTSGNVASTGSFTFTVDNTAPTVTRKAGVIVSNGFTANDSYALHDTGQIDKIAVNGVMKNQSNNPFSDVNGLKPGVFGAVEGLNTLVVYDVAGNSTTVLFNLDTTGPTATVDASVGSNNVWQTVSFKLYDQANVVKATLNGVDKNLTPNPYSDLNGLKPGVFGAVEGLNTLVLTDALGNTSTITFTLDTTKPVITTPAADQWVSGTHTWNISQVEANPAKAYVEIDQLVNGKWAKKSGVWINNSNDLTTSFDTTGLADNVQTQIKISSWDTAGNQSGASFSVKIDNTKPTATVKPESIQGVGGYESVSYKLNDPLSGIDYVLVNGVKKDVSNNALSDVNGLKPGVFGAVLGNNTLTVVDVAGNQSTYNFTLVAPVAAVTGPGNGGNNTLAPSGPTTPSITLASSTTDLQLPSLAMTGTDPTPMEEGGIILLGLGALGMVAGRKIKSVRLTSN